MGDTHTSETEPLVPLVTVSGDPASGSFDPLSLEFVLSDLLKNEQETKEGDKNSSLFSFRCRHHDRLVDTKNGLILYKHCLNSRVH